MESTRTDLKNDERSDEESSQNRLKALKWLGAPNAIAAGNRMPPSEHPPSGPSWKHPGSNIIAAYAQSRGPNEENQLIPPGGIYLSTTKASHRIDTTRIIRAEHPRPKALRQPTARTSHGSIQHRNHGLNQPRRVGSVQHQTRAT